ncbi:YceI family protein [Actinomadura sp. 6K520]|jgi:polyisoprenoid-binding protein YceI|uniref:YceI family protein n=1 Tax=Actinomadura sp. 6K520 TaxID=2530364 RepID=UPI00104EEEE1|nr:YceI family protein [Actinomadura sp. 6K520]TDE26969.1 YceI family protein [Actinomadura sp. 6K520]
MKAQLVEIPGYVAGTWTIDPAHSNVGFTVRHLMVSKVRGRFGTFEGTIVTGDDPLDSSVSATIDLASIDTGIAQRDAHVRSADYLDVEKYPTMTYRSTGLRPDGDDFVLDGELALRGMTKQVPLKLEIGGFSPDPFLEDPFKGARVGFTATGEISRLEFGVGDTAKVPGGAGLGLGEKVQITLEVQAVLQNT